LYSRPSTYLVARPIRSPQRLPDTILFCKPFFCTEDNGYSMILQRHFLVLALVIGALLVCSGCTQPSGTVTQSTEAIPAVTASPVPSTVATLSSQDYVLLETTMGNITIALDPDMPITSGNFEKLVKSEYYNGIIFHRVIPGFMIQGGDPT